MKEKQKNVKPLGTATLGFSRTGLVVKTGFTPASDDVQASTEFVQQLGNATGNSSVFVIANNAAFYAQHCLRYLLKEPPEGTVHARVSKYDQYSDGDISACTIAFTLLYY